MQRRALARADWLFPVSRALDDYLRSSAPTRARTAVVPCLLQKLHSPEAVSDVRRAARESLGVGERPVLLYVGSASAWQKVPYMIEVFTELRRRVPTAFLLVISGNEGEFRRLAALAGLPDAAFRVAGLPHDEVWSLAAAGDVGLLFRDDTLVNRVASPTKFAEYLSFGVPVAVSDAIADAAALVRRCHLGVVVPSAATPTEAAGQLAKFLSGPENLGAAARNRCLDVARSDLTLASVLCDYQEVYSVHVSNVQ